MEKITILGAGSWGTALAILLANKNYDVKMWLRNEEHCKELIREKENKKYLPGVKLPSNIKFTCDIEQAVLNSKIIVTAVASQAIRNVIKMAKNKISKDAIIVNVSKGIEKETGFRISEVIKQELKENEYVVLSGPSHAEEVSKEMPTTVVVASENLIVAEYIQDIFITPTFRVYTNPDVIGVELGGTFKNIIAFCAGIADGLGFGDNTKAALITRGIQEIARLGIAMGAKTDTFSGLSGIGDLIVTCTSMHSRNRRAGILVGQGKSVSEALEEVKMVVEGVIATEVAFEMSKKFNVSMPITQETYNVIKGKGDARESVENLMLRSKKHETEEIAKLN